MIWPNTNGRFGSLKSRRTDAMRFLRFAAYAAVCEGVSASLSPCIQKKPATYPVSPFCVCKSVSDWFTRATMLLYRSPSSDPGGGFGFHRSNRAVAPTANFTSATSAPPNALEMVLPVEISGPKQPPRFKLVQGINGPQVLPVSFGP